MTWGGGGVMQSDEYWSSATASEVAGEQPCGARRPADHLPAASLADNRSPFTGSVAILDVESKDFVGAGGGFVQHLPQGFFS